MTPLLEAANRARDAAADAEKAADKLRDVILALASPASGPPAALFDPDVLTLVSEADARARFAEKQLGRILSIAVAQVLSGRICTAEARRMLDAIERGSTIAKRDCTCELCTAKRAADAEPEGTVH